jgi:hypothetical protein
MIPGTLADERLGFAVGKENFLGQIQQAVRFRLCERPRAHQHHSVEGRTIAALAVFAPAPSRDANFVEKRFHSGVRQHLLEEALRMSRLERVWKTVRIYP